MRGDCCCQRHKPCASECRQLQMNLPFPCCGGTEHNGESGWTGPTRRLFHTRLGKSRSTYHKEYTIRSAGVFIWLLGKGWGTGRVNHVLEAYAECRRFHCLMRSSLQQQSCNPVPWFGCDIRISACFICFQIKFLSLMKTFRWLLSRCVEAAFI